MVAAERIKKLNTNNEAKAHFVIYWMQQSQRTFFNQALEYAILKANELNKPLLVYFGLTDQFPDANLRHYQFMLQGLQKVQENLLKRNIQCIIRLEHPMDGISKLSRHAAVVIVDCGYLKIQKEWRKTVAKRIDCPLIQVESDVIIPVETASDKEEYAAYTLRPKIHGHLPKFLTKVNEHKVKRSSVDFNFSSLSLTELKPIFKKLDVDTSILPVPSFQGGEDQAKKLLMHFINNNIQQYESKRNDPSCRITSQLSSYLHFGQISPAYIALEIKKKAPAYADSFLEELIVRRELSMNFVHFNNSYDSISCLPSWAFDSLKKHESDTREYEYTLNELEQADTHDPYWNAAQKEMMITGKMHGYMRMYWGKKILEWTDTASEAFSHALFLNNKYELDGRDPNGFAGVAWCFGKHDRAWKERLIFGKVRYMNQAGLKRKGHIEEYVTNVEKKWREVNK